MTDRGRDPGTGGDDPVPAVYAATPFEADAVVAALRARGIDAYAAHRALEGVFPALFSNDGTAVMVRAADLDRARALLATDADPGAGDAEPGEGAPPLTR